MVKVKRGTEATEEKTTVAPDKPRVEKKKPAALVKTATPAKTTGLRFSFKRWFVSKGYKPHWRAGMEAFTDTSGLRTAEEWDHLFKAY